MKETWRARESGAGRRKRRGLSLVELLAAVLLLAIAAAGAMGHWHLGNGLTATKRVSEMGIYIGVRELERVKAARYLGIISTPPGSPIVRYYDRTGAPVGSAVPRGYKTKTTITALVDRDSVANSEDLREVHIEVWDSAESAAAPYESIRTLISFGGI